MRKSIISILILASSYSYAARTIKVYELPETIRKICSDGRGWLAEIGNEWNPSDFLGKSNIPQARLVEACESEKIFQAKCQLGGRGVASHRLTAKRANSKAKWGKAIEDKPYETPLDCSVK